VAGQIALPTSPDTDGPPFERARVGQSPSVRRTLAVYDGASGNPALPTLNGALDREGALVTIEALQGQIVLAVAVRSAGADAFMKRGGNETTRHVEVAAFFEGAGQLLSAFVSRADDEGEACGCSERRRF
jgi:hypothetical protein